MSQFSPWFLEVFGKENIGLLLKAEKGIVGWFKTLLIYHNISILNM
jgi:hypothetical protein